MIAALGPFRVLFSPIAPELFSVYIWGTLFAEETIESTVKQPWQVFLIVIVSMKCQVSNFSAGFKILLIYLSPQHGKDLWISALIKARPFNPRLILARVTQALKTDCIFNPRFILARVIQVLKTAGRLFNPRFIQGCGSLVVTCWTANRKVRVQIPASAEIWIEISAPLVISSLLSYDE